MRWLNARAAAMPKVATGSCAGAVEEFKMSSHFNERATRRAVCTLALAVAGGPAAAAGFQLNESSASGLGSAFAGGAAAAEDTAMLWTNPAGLTRLPRMQVAGALHLVRPSIKFSNGASAAATSQPLGDDGGDAGGLNLVPNLYLAVPLGAGFAAGVGVTAPWGLKTEYDDSFIGRFQATRSSIRTVNVNPGIAWKPAAPVSLGFGLNVQRLDAEFNNLVNYSAALLSAAVKNGIAPGSATFTAIAQATPALASRASVKGHDTGYGWNAGLLWDLGADSRLGLHYRSPVRYKVAGDVHFENPALPAIESPTLAATVGALAAGVNAAALYDSGVTADVKIPAIANLSFVGAVGGGWSVMADLQWTQWSTIQNLRFVRADGSTLQDTPENFRDAWKLAVGTAWRTGGPWTLRGGLAWDQTPARDEFRTPRLPDSDRTWLAAGAQYAFDPQLQLDFGLAYLFGRKGSIDKSGDPANAAAYGRLEGHYTNRTLIVSGQLSYSF